MNPDVAHIVYASDDRFAEILGVTLVSLYENSSDRGDVIVGLEKNDIMFKSGMTLIDLKR